MIELEIQALSESRDGLLIDVGKSIVASGFTLQRQRLAQDANGVLVTLVVRGPARKQRALEDALDANPRIISFIAAPLEDGPPRPHFAATRTFAHPLPPPAPAPEPAPATPAPVSKPAARQPIAASAVPSADIATVPPIAIRPPATAAIPAQVAATAAPAAAPEAPPKAAPQPEPEPEFVFIVPSAPAPKAAAPAADPFVEIIPLDPDTDAVEKIMPRLLNGYPQIFACVQSLETSVVAGARESSLWLAGQRTGAWVLERDYAMHQNLSLNDALEHVGMPALRALVDVQNTGGQLHIRNSPLCTEGGRSNCKFFSGYIEGLLGPILGSNSLSIFAICCRSYGADECVLAVSD